jgi:ACT domain-containing protein
MNNTELINAARARIADLELEIDRLTKSDMASLRIAGERERERNALKTQLDEIEALQHLQKVIAYKA